MEYRNLGGSGLKVPVLMLGTATFGGGSDFFKKWGTTDVAEATSLVDAALDMGCNMFDTADAYSRGLSEEILGKAVEGRRDKVLLATKMGMAMGDGPNDVGTSRARIIQCCEASLQRLGTDYIDLYQLHSFDAQTPIEEMLYALDALTRAGKIRYFGVSNYSGWHLMKMLSLADKHSLPKPVTHQVYYTLTDRDFEWELMPLGLDQNVGTLVWSPLAGAKLSGKVGRNKTAARGQPGRHGRQLGCSGRASVQNHGCARTDFARDRAIDPARRVGLVTEPSDRFVHRDRCPERDAAQGQPGSGRSEAQC